MHDPGLLRRLREVTEAFIPWFDRAAADRERAAMRVEMAASRATRESARLEVMRTSFGRAGERLAKR